MNKTLIVYCHPYPKSFNHAVLERLQQNESESATVTVVDLYTDGFDPRYELADLAAFRDGETTDPLVTRYRRLLHQSDKLIIISPIWWNDLPGMLKGFFDKVLRQNDAYIATNRGVQGKLTNIKQAEIYTTSTSPTWYLKLFCGNAIQKVVIHGTLHQIGVAKTSWHNFGGITKSTNEQRMRYLNQLIG